MGPASPFCRRATASAPTLGARRASSSGSPGSPASRRPTARSAPVWRSYSSSCAVLPITWRACSAFFTPGISTAIWSLPCFVITGSATPSLSTRLRMISFERSRSDFSSFSPRPERLSARPPGRPAGRGRAPALVAGDPGIAIRAAPISARRSTRRGEGGLRFARTARGSPAVGPFRRRRSRAAGSAAVDGDRLSAVRPSAWSSTSTSSLSSSSGPATTLAHRALRDAHLDAGRDLEAAVVLSPRPDGAV